MSFFHIQIPKVGSTIIVPSIHQFPLTVISNECIKENNKVTNGKPIYEICFKETDKTVTTDKIIYFRSEITMEPIK